MDQFRRSDLSADRRALLAKRIRGELAKESFAGIPKRSGAGPIPMSFAQERMWFLEQFFPGTAVYNIPNVLRIEGPLDLEALEKSLNELICRHEVLRTTFATVNDEPCQIVKDAVEVPFVVHDLTDLQEAAREAEADRLTAEEAGLAFDLKQGPLLRARALKLHEQEYRVLLTFHHLVADGWSLGVTVGEIAALYESFAAGERSPLPELPVQYADYSLWQREQMQGVMAKQLDYWKGQLGEQVKPLELPIDKPRPAQPTFQGSICSLYLSQELVTKIRALCEQEGVTLFMALLTAFQVFLHRYTGETDIRVGTPVAGRNRGEIEGLIGLFVNTLTMRADLLGDPGFCDVLQQVRKTCLDAFANQDLPFEKLVEELQVERNVSQSPLFQVMFAVRGVLDTEFHRAELAWQPLDRRSNAAMFDLTVAFVERAEALSLQFEYSTDLFERETIERMMRHFVNLLESIVSRPNERVGELRLLDEHERVQMMVAWNDTTSEYPRQDAVHRVFEAQAKRTPDAVALEFAEISLTYRELNEQANRLARKLVAMGATGQFVGVYMERSIELIVSFLAVLKAGAAYVPLDVSYPVERLGYMLDDSQAAVLLTQAHLQDRLTLRTGDVLAVDLAAAELAATAASDLEELVTSDAIAYMMYTSGSTGKPKGVCVLHRGIVRLIKGVNYADLTEREVFLQYAPVAFDGSTFEIWGALLSGGRLVMFPPYQASLEELGRVVVERGVTTLLLTSGLFNQMIDSNLEALRGLRQLLTGGDVMSVAHAKKVLAGLTCRLINVYGPTENTTFTTTYEVKSIADIEAGVPIGVPVANTTVYVLDERMQPLPPGVPGELCTGGDGLALGYWNLPELTVERFVEDPFASDPDAYLYKTGDLARWRNDGNLEFLGRIDNQVKLRGFRIELGEIEATLQEHEAIREAAVILHQDARGEKRLVAYAVQSGEAEADAIRQEVRAFLQERLPEYMVPQTFVLLDALPLTANGKVDRLALPAPDELFAEVRSEYVAPRTPIEERVAALFSELLDVSQVGLLDDFFDLGGHSLLATRLLTKIRTELGVELPMRELFVSASTVEGLASLIEREQQAKREETAQPQIGRLKRGARTMPPILPTKRTSPYQLSFSQQRLWFLDRLMTEKSAYHISTAVRFAGDLQLEALAKSFREIVKRHKALSTTFVTVDGEPMQVIAEQPYLAMPLLDLTHLPDEVRERTARELVQVEVERAFDLSQDLLLRTGLFKLTAEEHLLVVVMHHIISDGWSLGVFIEELSTLYDLFVRGEASTLPALPVQYFDYAEWQRYWLQGEVLDEQVGYWKKQLAGELPVLQLAADRPRPVVQSYRGAGIDFRLSKELTNGLKKLGKRDGATLYMTLLATFQALLFRHSGQEDFIIGSPIAGRAQAEVEGLIGFFTNTLAMRADLSGDPTFRELLSRARKTALDAYAHQDVPFERLVEELRVARNLSHSPIFQTMFVLQNTPKRTAELPGAQLSVLPIESKTAKFDLLLDAEEWEDGILCTLEYSTDLFEEQTVRRLLHNWERLIEQVVHNAEQKVSEIDLLTDADVTKLLAWGSGQQVALEELCVHQLFERQALRTPDALAVLGDGQTLSYRQLDRLADRWAAELVQSGVSSGSRVGLCLERSPELIVAILAVLKAGGCCVPLDKTHPQERLSFVLADAGISVLVTQRSSLDQLPHQGLTVLFLEGEPTASAGRSAGDEASLEAEAYLLYTSGTTGVPKGVLMHHLPLANLIGWQLGDGRFLPEQRTLQYAAATFDVFFQELFSALCSGGTLVLLAEEVRQDALRLVRFLQEQRVERMFLPSVALQQIAESFRALEEEPLALREIYTAGDQLQLTPAISHLIGHGADCQLFNQYGPTETHVVSAHEVTGDLSFPPIGRPIHNAELFILDQKGSLQLIGVPGELYIGGLSVARGYAGREELTRERFVTHRYGRLYRTGDLVRWSATGEVEFLGRVDDQVKIRGFRVELGEVESALLQHPHVQAAAVLAREVVPGEKSLVAYVVFRQGMEVTKEGLRSYLSDVLPGYMLPSYLMFLDQLPLNASRKVDRKALPTPEGDRAGLQAEYLPPRTPLEQALAELYAKVLNLPQVGAADNFFELGGHSLLATRLLSLIMAELKVEVPVATLFAAPTVAELAEKLSDCVQMDEEAWRKLPDQAEGTDELDEVVQMPLSFAQQRLWLVDQMDPGTSLYNIPTTVRMIGKLDVRALEQAFHEMICRHESLRTVFKEIDGEPMQVIEEPEFRPLPLLDLRGFTDVEAEIYRLAEAEQAYAFDLAKGPLVRLQLLKAGAEDHVLLLTMHHIISDGWSMGVFISEFGVLYDAFSKGQPSPLPELSIQYADYAYWQRERLQGEVLEQQIAYWKQKLGGERSVLQLPTDRPRPAVQTHRGDIVTFMLDHQMRNMLVELGRREGATLYMTLLSAFNILLSRYSGQDDISVGTPIAGRNRAQLEALIGFFVNTLVMRTDLSGDLSFSDLLRQVKGTTLEAYAHQEMPFEMLVAELQPERNMSHSPLFQVMFALQNTPLGSLEVEGMTFQQVELSTEQAKFDLTMTIGEGESELYGTLSYNADLFDQATAQRMVDHFVHLLELVVERPEAKLHSLPLLTERERQQMLYEWNRTNVELPELLVHQLFERQAETSPERVALVFGEQTLSYEQLNQQANRVARCLQNRGVTNGALVGLAMERSIEMIVGVLAILKAGGAYVPIDVSYPAERLRHMLDDTQLGVILTQAHLAEKLPPHSAQTMSIDALTEEIAAESGENLSSADAPDSLAYVMYTSGSTGMPKGVLIPHSGIVRLVYGPTAALPYTSDDVALQYAPISFDASTLEIWGALLNGAKLVVFPPFKASAEEIGQAIQAHGVTVLFLTAGLFQQMVDVYPEGLRGLRLLGSGGEAMSAHHARQVLEQLGCPVLNLYGPTEVTTVATAQLLTTADQIGAIVPIGRPIAKTTAYVLDEQMQPVPVGVTGELHVGGVGLAHGYLNRTDLTDEKFVDSPFIAGERLYKTGDSVRWLADGTLEYVGRIDNQVKIRGFRIELGEIEAVLAQHLAVVKPAVLVRDAVSGLKRLVAYLVLDPAQPVDLGELRQFVRDRLPDYMQPSAYVVLESFPLTANGKLDERSLPEPEGRPDLEIEYVAPRGEVEEKLAQLFAELLEVEQVGAFDHFFELGGHSLLGARLISRIREVFQAELPLRALFDHPTVAGLAQLLGGEEQRATEVRLPPLRKAQRPELIPLSYAQQRLWFLDQLAPGSNAYNIPMAFQLHGSLDVEAVRRSFDEIISRHESLRTTFQLVEEQAVQVIAAALDFNLDLLDLSAEADREETLGRLVLQDAREPFDLQRGPLLRATLVKLGDEQHALLLNMHHIISDGWSTSVLVEEFAALYHAFSQGQPSPLKELPVQFADYAIWQRNWMQGETLAEQLGYWKEKLAGELPVLELPTDLVTAEQDGRSGKRTAVLSKGLTHSLKQLGQQAGTTPFMTLLAAFKTLLSRLSGQEDLIVGTPVAGRNLVETEGLIGILLNTLALRTDLAEASSFRDLLDRVRETTLEAYAHQEVPFEKIVEEIQPDRDLHRNPIFDVMVNFVNTPDAELTLPNLVLAPLTANEDPASKFLMTLYISENEEQFRLSLVYQAGRFTNERMELFMEQFCLLLEQVVVDPDRELKRFSLITAAGSELLPDPQAEIVELVYPPVAELVADWAHRAPERAAVSQGERQWTYASLQRRAEELARALVASGVTSKSSVAVVGTRNFGFVTAMLGVLKSGGVLVPIDLHLPLSRQQVMVEQSKATHLLYVSDEQMSAEWQMMFGAFDIIRIDPERGITADRVADLTVELPELQPDDPAYLFFTSGTTGVPKGVLGCHKGLNHFLAWQRDTFRIGPDDRVAQLIHLSFDAVLRDVFLPLTSGATLCLPEVTDDLGGDVILPWLERERITLLHTVPSVAQAWASEPPSSISLPSLRYLFLAGEPLSDVLVNRLRTAFPKMGEIINLYGPTETTMVKCYYIVPKVPAAGIQPAGVPFPQTQALVLNESFAVCGIGEQGEIVLRTPYRSLGYINAPQEQKKFVQNPHRPHDSSDLLYLTGDKGRYLPDGSLEILGRMDDQVKVRGVRIQLHEVSSTLLGHDAVDACAVIDWKDERGQTALAAYVVCKQGVEASAEELRSYLEQRLLAAMVPTSYQFLDSLPRLANGKVDRKALPKPERGSGSTATYVEPRTEIESLIADLFAEVLGVERVGVHDNFFSRGGHSLMATQLISRIRQRLQRELPLRLLFERPTVAALAECVERDAGTLDRTTAIRPVDRAGQLPLSFAQQRLWFLDQLDPLSVAYNIPLVMRIEGLFDAALLQRTLQEIVRRHESLRTNFQTVNGQAVQVIQAERVHALPVIDLMMLSDADRSSKIAELIEAEINMPFDLTEDALLRTKLVKVSEQEHLFLFTMHHIISDGWSMGVFTRELMTLCAAFERGEASPLPELAIQYADYSVWQREQLQGERLEQLLGYWKERFAGEIPVLQLPTDRPRPAQQTFRGDSVKFALSEALSERLNALSQAEGVTLYMTLLAAFSTLLSRYSGQDDLVLGAPIAGRNRAEIEPLIGFFVNTLALRTDLSGNPSFRELLQRVKETALGGFAHQDLPFEMLIDQLGIERDMSRSPLCQVTFLLQNAPTSEFALQDVTLTSVDVSRTSAKFDLTLMMTEGESGIGGVLEYRTDLFEASTIERMATHFSNLLEAITADPSASIGQLPLMSPAEEQTLLVEWNQTEVALPNDAYLHRLFEAQVERTPDRTALIFGEQELTYRELNEKANQLARILQRIGVEREQRVGIVMERSMEMIIGIMAVLKAGGAYVPLDPAAPSERLAYMLGDAGAEVLLTLQKHLASLPEHRSTVLAVDEERLQIAKESADNLNAEVETENLAYVIYTSGSTGRPKGVLVPHRGVCNTICYQVGIFQIDTDSRMLQFASLSFDASVMEIFTPLIAGGSLVLASQEQLLPGAGLAELIRQHRVTDVILTPAVLTLLPEQNLPTLRTILSAGEACSTELAERWSADGRTFINAYGPTEASIEATLSINPNLSRLPDIGRPIGNCQVYVLDSFKQPVPIGVAGELYIGGQGLARGYHNRPELTEESFVAHPFTSDRTARLYRSGDLVRWLADGNIEYLGRIDHQVKLRGFRIELGEIEAALSLHEQVQEAVVVPHTDKLGTKRLVAYYVAVEPATVSAEELRGRLKGSLPDYMLPAYFIELDALPLTSSGKVDRRALPEPEQGLLPHREYLPPQTDTELLLAELWTGLLGREQIGRDENFFEIGGHSLLATQLASRVRETFRVELPLRTLFEAPTIQSLADRLEADLLSGSDAAELIEMVFDETGDTPLSFAQQRLWFIDQLEPGSAAYNISTLMRLTGLLNVDVLAQSLGEMVRRHESLRTSFPSREGEPMQVVQEELLLDLSVVDLRAEAEPKAHALRAASLEVERPFDLASGPLFRVAVYQVGEAEHLLLLLMHHIISDGWSMSVFLNELVTLYAAFEKGEPSPLASLPLQYAGFSRWQRQHFHQELMQQQLDYWKEQLGGELSILELPTDRPRQVGKPAQGAKWSFQLSELLSQKLRDLSQQESATLYMTLLTAFQTLLFRYTGQEDILIGSPIAGRNRKEVEHLIGFFVNTLVLRTALSGDRSFAELLQQVKRTTLDAFAHQDVPFEMLVAELQPDRNLGRSPLFQAMFVLQNTPAAGVEVPGLKLEGVPLENNTAKFDLTLMMVETESGLSAHFEYNADLWEASTIERMSGHFVRLLEAIADDQTRQIGRLPMLSAAEANQLLVEWNKTQSDYPRESAVHQLFEQQVMRAPDAVALIFDKREMTYRQLNESANRLARRLQTRGLLPGQTVGISLERSMGMIIAMLATLKAGGVYVPLDTSYPEDRLLHMLEDSQIEWLLTESDLAGRLPDHRAEVVLVDDRTLEVESAENLMQAASAESLAYIMYTSGSTGLPKGVQVRHRGIVRLVCGTNYAQFTDRDVFLQFAPIAFDAATLEIWAPLLNGGKLVIFPPEQASLDRLGEVIQQRGVTTLWLTAGLFHSMVEHHPEMLRGVRQLLAGGDVLSAAHVRKALEHLDGCLINGYGPTENTTFTTCHLMTDPSEVGHTVPIGRPLANTSVYVLDAQMQPVPIGVVGELYTGGDGVALGYLNRPELTEQLFVPNPFGAGTLYRTGDAVRWLASGELEFVGRIDSQVKLRGFRVEIGEIEAALSKHPAVREVAVLIRQDAGEKRLVAFLTEEATGSLTAAELSAYLRQSLPDYMVPASFEVLDALPLTPNGKLDRRALAARELRYDRSAVFVAPQDRYELELAHIWSELLGASRISVTDNFFSLGGHSLLAVRMIAQIEKRLGQKLPLSALFQQGTIESLAALLRQGGQASPATPLVTIQPDLAAGAVRPLFLVHPVGGSVFSYLDLARELGVEQPIYGLQSPGLDDDREPIDTIEEMAIAYLDAIRTVQPEGPYRLGGWSLGGTIAFEMARQLRTIGEQVELLALIDTRAPLPEYQREMEETELLLSFARDLAGQHGLELERVAEDEAFRTAMSLPALLELSREHQVLPPELSYEELTRLFNVFRNNYRAFTRYLPDQTDERVLLIQAENAESDEYGWRQLVGELIVHRIGGNHFTLIKEPNVNDLSEILKQHLAEVKISL